MTKNKKLKAKLLSFGCQMNSHDTERMATILEENGFDIEYGSITKKEDLDGVDYLIVNTCTVREKPENKWLSILNSFIDKKQRPIVAVTGCVVQQKKETLLNNPIDILLGVDNEDKIFEAFKNIKLSKNNVDIVETEFLEQLPTSTLIREKHNNFAYVMVSKGCNNFCTYCIVPFVRGREISRPINNIAEDVKNLVQERGIEHISLLAQNISSYGFDIGTDFYTLLDKVSSIQGLKRVSFLTSHPKDFDTKIISLMEERENISTLLHLPVQHGSDRLLKEMNRQYTREDYLHIIDLIYKSKLAKKINLTTDIIIGFPTETDKDFEELMDILRLARFDNSFSFIYSPRPGTVAYKKYGTKYSTKDLKKIYSQRLAEYQKLQKEIALEKNNTYIGETELLFIESIKDNTITGRIHNGKLTHIKNVRTLKQGSFVKVKITGAHPTFLDAELID